jgi:hypothetical protein
MIARRALQQSLGLFRSRVGRAGGSSALGGRAPVASTTTLGLHQQHAFRPLSAAPAAAPVQTTSFCFQCEQTADQKGCGSGNTGVCGKTPGVSLLQDALIQQLKGVAAYASQARSVGDMRDEEVDGFLLEAMFSTLTNVVSTSY